MIKIIKKSVFICVYLWTKNKYARLYHSAF